MRAFGLDEESLLVLMLEFLELKCVQGHHFG
jgi:hypothetical protein